MLYSSYSSLTMVDEWNEIESVGKSLGREDFTSPPSEPATPKKEQKTDTKTSPQATEVQSKNKLTADDAKDGSGSSSSGGNRPKQKNNDNQQHNGGRGGHHRGGRGGGGSSGRNNYQHQGHRNENNRNDHENNDNSNRKSNYSGGGGGRGRGSRGVPHNHQNNDRRSDEIQNRLKKNDDNRGGRNGGFGGDSENQQKNMSRSHRSNNDSGNDDRPRRNFNDREQRGGHHRNHRGAGDARGGHDKKEKLYIPPNPTENEDELFGMGISSGIHFDKYNEIPTNVSGENIPPAIENFADSGLIESLIENIMKSGYKTPTPVQKQAIPIILKKRDLMACAQTGSGKTAAFLLPIINNLLKDECECVVGKPQVVILSPTRELAIQIYNETRKFAMKTALKTCIVYGGTSSQYQSDNLEKGCHILIATPGRLEDFVDKKKVSFENTTVFVLDEADRMLDMGFIGNVELLMNNSTMPNHEKRQTVMVSATFPEEIQRLAGKFLNNYLFLAVGIIGGACSDVEQNLYEVSKFEKRKKLIALLEKEDPQGVMVFVETKRNADFLATILSETKIPTTSIHGDREQREREEALRDFKCGTMKLLIATSVAARGLDIKNVTHVINYDMPNSIDEYVHRIGRTGRLGNCGRATSFFDPEQDYGIAADLKKILIQAKQEVPEFLDNVRIPTGDGGSRKGNFGGKDVRKKRTDDRTQSPEVAPVADEPEEQW